MKILITGGLGNLGLWLTNHFLDIGHEVSVLGRNERVVIRRNNYQFLCADITDIHSLKKTINSYYDVCIHTASFNEHFIVGYAEKALQINALGTDFLCKALALNGVGKVIYLSTYHVYGLNEGVVSESSPILPCNDYALTHYFAEKYIEKNAKKYGLKYVIFRLTNSYGCPKDINTDKWYLVLNDLCRQAHGNRSISLTSNGRAIRDFIWMGDVLKVIEISLEIPALLNMTYNLSSGSSFSIIEIVSFVKTAFFEVYQEELTVSVNSSDLCSPQFLKVSNTKLNTLIQHSFSNQIVSEAKNIFYMLDRD